MVNLTYVNYLQLATNLSYVRQLESTVETPPDGINFVAYQDSFVSDVLGADFSQELVAETTWAAFHEAGVYNIETGKLYATSNRADDVEANPINVTAIDIGRDANSAVSIDSLHFDQLAQANGACAYYPPGTPPDCSANQSIVFCDQGTLTRPAQLVQVDPATNTSRVLLNNFLGRNFTSPNDIIQHPLIGDLWFTDPYYAFWQGFRPEPDLRQQIYRFEPATGVVQAVADGFVAVNGIEFSPDWEFVYVSDTGFATYPGVTNASDPASIYRYRISADGKRLQDRQLFAYSDAGLPDGLHTDTEGNVYAGCGDGVHVWNPAGVLMGKIAVDGGAANFAFVPEGMFIFNEKRLFRVGLKAQGRTMARDFGLHRPDHADRR
ncbi:lactonohydrolase [Hortaea werneckii]|nr:lactonohydrolase [Hortaea werneckii]